MGCFEATLDAIFIQISCEALNIKDFSFDPTISLLSEKLVLTSIFAMNFVTKSLNFVASNLSPVE